MKIKFTAITLCIFLLLVGCAANSAEQDSAPDFSLTSLTGEELNLEDLKGKVIILDFFATWCPPCRMEIPHFNNLFKTYKDKGVIIIGVCSDNIDRQKAKALKIKYPVAKQTPDILNAYGPINAIPTTFVIDKQGQIYKKYIGYRTEEVFQEDIIQLLNEN